MPWATPLPNPLPLSWSVRNKHLKYYELLLEMVRVCIGQEQLQTVLCLKNSVSRNIKGSVTKPGQKPIVLVNPGLKSNIKQFCLDLATAPASSMPFNIFQQSLEIVRIFIKLDFPSKWPELCEHIFGTLDSIAANLDSIGSETIEDFYRFLKFYLEVLKEQNIKKLGTKRAAFVEQAKTHLQKLYPVWQNIDLKSMDIDKMQKFTQDDGIIFEISKLLDKWAVMVMQWGFSINDLANKNENVYIRMVEELVQKLTNLVETTTKLYENKDNYATKNIDEMLDKYYSWVKNLIKKLSDLQYSEPLLFYTSLKQYMELWITILVKKDSYDEKCHKVAMLAIYRVVNSMIYNHTGYNEKENQVQHFEPQNIGITNLPAKYKNFQEEVKQVITWYREVLQEENIANLLDLLVGKYLQLRSFDIWVDDPESFIEIEDELQFMRDSNINSDCNYNLLAYAVCSKLFDYFKDTSNAWLAKELSILFNNKIPSEKLLEYSGVSSPEAEDENGIQQSIPVEDAVLSLVGALPSIYRYKSVPEESRIKVEVVLDYLEKRITESDNKILKRRYWILLSLWADEISIESVLDYLAKSCSILFSGSLNDPVIEFVALSTFRDILRTVEDARTSHKSKAITEERSSLILNAIEQRLDYKELFASISPICIHALNRFTSPTQIWKCMNLLGVLIEGWNENSDESALENFKNIDFMKVIQMESPFLKDTLYDMWKNLITIFKGSISIFEINFKLIEFYIQSAPDYELFDQWLYVMRIFDFNNNQEAKQMWIQFFITYHNTLKEYGMSVKFSILVSEIIQEYILADMVPSILDTSQK